jgi:hypothetical protein
MELIILIAVVLFFMWINSGSSSSSSSRSSYNSNRQSATYRPPVNPNIKRETIIKTPTPTSSIPSSITKSKVSTSMLNPHPLSVKVKKQVEVQTKSIFTPLSGIDFQVFNSSGQYKWYAIYNYYPVKRFNADQLSSNDLEARRHVYEFKDGRNPEHYSRVFASAIINKFGSNYLSNKILVIVPASSKSKTEIRFKEFCNRLCSYTGAFNGYDMLANNDVVRVAAHAGGNRNTNLEKYLIISDSFAGKHIIVIDDVRTSGSSSNKIYEILISRNVASVTFFYLAKTVSGF